MVTGHDHQRLQDDGGEGIVFRIVDDIPEVGFRLDGADVIVLEVLLVELRVQFLIDLVGIGFRAVAHEGDEGLAVVEGLGVFRDGVDDLVEVLVRGQERRAEFDGVEPAFIVGQFLFEVVVFVAVHQVRRLDDEGLDAVRNGSVERFLDVVDGEVVSLFQLVDDDLAREGTADLILRVCFGNGVLDRADGLLAAVVVARAEADDEDGRGLVFLHAGIDGLGAALFHFVASGGKRHQEAHCENDAKDLFNVFHGCFISFPKLSRKKRQHTAIVLRKQCFCPVDRRLSQHHSPAGLLTSFIARLLFPVSQ